jgi:hypothetical protein
MRLYPPAWNIGRRASRDYDRARYTLPRGSLFAVAPGSRTTTSAGTGPVPLRPRRWLPDGGRRVRSSRTFRSARRAPVHRRVVPREMRGRPVDRDASRSASDSSSVPGARVTPLGADHAAPAPRAGPSSGRRRQAVAVGPPRSQRRPSERRRVSRAGRPPGRSGRAPGGQGTRPEHAASAPPTAASVRRFRRALTPNTSAELATSTRRSAASPPAAIARRPPASMALAVPPGAVRTSPVEAPRRGPDTGPPDLAARGTRTMSERTLLGCPPVARDQGAMRRRTAPHRGAAAEPLGRELLRSRDPTAHRAHRLDRLLRIQIRAHTHTPDRRGPPSEAAAPTRAATSVIRLAPGAFARVVRTRWAGEASTRRPASRPPTMPATTCLQSRSAT